MITDSPAFFFSHVSQLSFYCAFLTLTQMQNLRNNMRDHHLCKNIIRGSRYLPISKMFYRRLRFGYFLKYRKHGRQNLITVDRAANGNTLNNAYDGSQHKKTQKQTQKHPFLCDEQNSLSRHSDTRWTHRLTKDSAPA